MSLFPVKRNSILDMSDKSGLSCLVLVLVASLKWISQQRCVRPATKGKTYTAGKGGTDHHIRNFTSVWKQDTRIQELEEDGSQRDGGAAL